MIENPNKVTFAKLLIARKVYSELVIDSFRATYRSAVEDCDAELQLELSRLHGRLKLAIKRKIISSSVFLALYYRIRYFALNPFIPTGHNLRDLILPRQLVALRENLVSMAEAIAFKSQSCHRVFSPSLA